MKISKLLLFFLITFSVEIVSRSKVLHLTFHRGCLQQVEEVMKQFDMDITSVMVQDMPARWLDGQTEGNAIYNITHSVASRTWKLHKEFFNQFDAIITSDTAPLSRIFLQNNWKKPLIVYVCNRFDYADGGTSNGKFPDKEYYELMRAARSNPLVRIIPNTPFEAVYAARKGVRFDSEPIKPCGDPQIIRTDSSLTDPELRGSTFYIPPYQNETHFMNLAKKCETLGIPAFCGRHNGFDDIRHFKGVICLPYAPSTIALFENIQLGLIYFVPSKAFLSQLMSQGNFWYQDRSSECINCSEWYLPENAPLFVYFDSWPDLKEKIATLDYDKKRERVLEFAYLHRQNMLARWTTVFQELDLMH